MNQTRSIIFKKRMGVYSFIFLFHSGLVYSQETTQYFIVGNTHYQNSEYEEALNVYMEVIDRSYESGDLYYNIGNCYYKLQNIGRAILYYERAKRLIPRDEDLKTNLALANLAVIDKITPRKEFLLFRIVRGFTHLLPKPPLIWIVTGFYLSTIGFIILWIVARNHILRRIAFRMGILLGILLLVFGLSLLGRILEEGKRIEGIILVDKVDVMSSPSDEGGMEVFSLHDGTKVRIDQKSGDWIEIVLADGKVGWVKSEVLEII